LTGETEVPGENLPQRYFVHHKSHLPDPGSNPGRRSGKPATNRLSYGAALQRVKTAELTFLRAVEVSSGKDKLRNKRSKNEFQLYSIKL
jgi:hypothetical protein